MCGNRLVTAIICKLSLRLPHGVSAKTKVAVDAACYRNWWVSPVLFEFRLFWPVLASSGLLMFCLLDSKQNREFPHEGSWKYNGTAHNWTPSLKRSWTDLNHAAEFSELFFKLKKSKCHRKLLIQIHKRLDVTWLSFSSFQNKTYCTEGRKPSLSIYNFFPCNRLKNHYSLKSIRPVLRRNHGP